MRFASSSIATTLVFAISVAAQQTTCFGDRWPDWDGCRELLSGFLAGSGMFPAPGGAGVCNRYFIPDINCQFSVCPDEDIPIRVQRVRLASATLEANCAANNAAGEYIEPAPDGFRLIVESNPNFVQVPMVEFSSTRVNSTSRVHPRDLSVRQQESDTSFDLFTLFTDITRPGFTYDVGPIIPGGGTVMEEVTNSISQTVTTGVSLSAGLQGVFTAETNVEISNEYTVSNSLGVTVTVNCPANAQGQVEWSPTWDRYDGAFQPSGDIVSIWIPVEDDAGQYGFRCLG